jgi:Peptidase S46
MIRRREVALRAFAERNSENARRAQSELFSYQNARKARLGMLAGLQDPGLMAAKRSKDAELRTMVNAKPEFKAKFGSAWDEIARAIDTWDKNYTEHYLWERRQAFNSTLFGHARNLLRLAEESRKPNAERLREYAESGLPSLKMEILSEAPVYDDLEIVKLTDSLSMLLEVAGAGDELVKQVLDGKSPSARAAELVLGSQLKDAGYRKRLLEGGFEAVRESGDPMIQLAGLVDPRARKFRNLYEQQVEEPLRQGYSKLAQARFAAYGSSVYPDATFTLRLSYGEVKGYESNGQKHPWTTTIGGAYAHAADHQFKEPFDLPQSWKDHKGDLDLNTPFNFVSTPDIIGGNSGSPVVDREGRVVGLIFDGTIESLVWDFVYDDRYGRATSVHSAAILEALRSVYGANNVLKELAPKQ